jgi:hypothetical protein
VKKNDKGKRASMLNPALRKKQLVAQGAMYRAEILAATEMTRAGLRPDSLARSALSQVVFSALAAFRGKGLDGGAGPTDAGMRLQTVLPLVISGVSALLKLSGRSAAKPLLRAALVAGAAAAVGAAVYLSKKKMARAAAEPDIAIQD